MSKAPQQSPLTGRPVPPYYLHSSSAFFRDTQGRAVLLRGVNFSGSAKAPLGQPSQRGDDFWSDAERGGRSFVGQPLNLQDGSADVHLQRLRLWGFNCFRWVFTWEALEHEGPGKYDHEYMDYIVQVLRKCKEYGFKVFMDPHQDVFSRFTGGSGAPYWVLPACGIDHRGLTPTQAAFVHSEWPSPDAPDPLSFPDMLWATGYVRLAPSTLSALFFAGHDVAPRCKIDGLPISTWLQNHFFGAVRELALKIQAAGDLFDETVIGWDSLNEPNKTYIGLQDVQQLPEEWKLRQGPMPTPVEGMRLATGQAQTVQNWVFTSLGPKRQGKVTVDPQGKSIWLTAEEDAKTGGSKWGWQRDADWPLGQCVWAAHGVWDQQTGDVLQPHYFNSFRQDKIDFIAQYWLPFWRRYASTIRPIHQEAIMFIQPPVFEPAPAELSEEHDLKGRVATSPHFYDGLTLVTKHWNWFNADAVGLLRGKYAGLPFALRFGERAVRKCIRDQLGYLKQDTADVLGAYPTLIGEIGIPFDLDNKKAYFGDAKGKGKGDYSAQTKAWDASMNACDGNNVLSYTLWTYCPDSTHLWGDGWNGEDLSIWSLDDVPGSEGSARSTDASVVPDVRTRSSSMTASVGDATAGLPARPTTADTYSSGTQAEDVAMQSDSDLKREGRYEVQLSPLRTATTQATSAKDSNATTLARLFAGARSAEAFSRPYPMATFGMPVSIDFDIKSSEFRYVIELDAEEQALPDKARPVTEIYVPMVHYAEDDLLGEVMGRSDASSEAMRWKQGSVSSVNSRLTLKEPDTATSSRSASTQNLIQSTSKPASQQSISRDPTLTTLELPAFKIDSEDGSSSSKAAIHMDERLPPLALDVSVSAGNWKVQGQVLKWHLSSSQATSMSSSNLTASRSPQDPSKIRHEIRIKRKGGAIGWRLQAEQEHAGQGGHWWDSCTLL